MSEQVGDHGILDDSKELAEQDVSNVDESEVVDMIDNSGDTMGKVVQDSVASIGNKEVTSEQEDEEAAEPGTSCSWWT